MLQSNCLVFRPYPCYCDYSNFAESTFDSNIFAEVHYFQVLDTGASHRLGVRVHSLKPPFLRSGIGNDAADVSPPGKSNDTHIYLVVKLFN